MRHKLFSKNKEQTTKRWVLLEHLPTILTPRILLLIFIYSVAFTLLLVGLKLFHLESAANTRKQRNVQAVSSTGTNTFLYPEENATQIQENISKNILRLHVIANSDTDADQNLKLMVRDEIISSLQNSLKNAKSVAQAKEVITSRQPQIKADALRVLSAKNSNYTVKVSLCTRYFPVKQYGDLTFPAGNYEALCVEIGKAAGHNWWCVLFPSLCFVNETTATVPDESKEKLQQNLSPTEYQSISEEKSDERPELRSGILDWFNK